MGLPKSKTFLRALESDMSKQKSIHLAFTATYKNLEGVGAWVRYQLRDTSEEKQSLSSGESQIFHDIELAVHEICNNIIEHAYGHQNGQIDAYFTFERREKCVTVDLYDTGQPFDSAEVSAPDLTIPQEGGYGLYLVHALLDEVTHSVHRLGNGTAGNHWHLVKYL